MTSARHVLISPPVTPKDIELPLEKLGDFAFLHTQEFGWLNPC
jgi:hypothetical protein